MDTVEMHEPYTYLNGLALEDLEDLLADIEVYVKIDLNKNKDFWSDIVTIVQDELSKLRKMERVSVLRQNSKKILHNNKPFDIFFHRLSTRKQLTVGKESTLLWLKMSSQSLR